MSCSFSRRCLRLIPIGQSILEKHSKRQMLNLPSSIQIEPVGQCNLCCEMCAIQFRKDGPPNNGLAFMTWETFISLLNGFPGLERLRLQGFGELMIHPHFFDIVRY